MAYLPLLSLREFEAIALGVDGKKALDVAWRFKLAHLSFALPDGLMGDFSPVVGVLLGAVLDRGESGPVGGGITAEFIGNESSRNELEPL